MHGSLGDDDEEKVRKNYQKRTMDKCLLVLDESIVIRNGKSLETWTKPAVFYL